MTYQLSYGYNELWINGYCVTGYYSEGGKFQFDTIDGVEVMEVDSTADQDQMLHALNWAVDTYIVGGNDDTPTTDPTEDGEETEGDDYSPWVEGEGATPRPFIVAFGGADNGQGGIAEEPIYAIYSSAEDYVLAGNNITESQRDGIWVNFAAIYLFHRPVGGYLLSLEEERQILF